MDITSLTAAELALLDNQRKITCTRRTTAGTVDVALTQSSSSITTGSPILQSFVSRMQGRVEQLAGDSDACFTSTDVDGDHCYFSPPPRVRVTCFPLTIRRPNFGVFPIDLLKLGETKHWLRARPNDFRERTAMNKHGARSWNVLVSEICLRVRIVGGVEYELSLIQAPQLLASTSSKSLWGSEAGSTGP